jgi:hypothetical protein
MKGFKITSVFLLVLFLGWLGFSLAHYSILRPAPSIVQPSSGFEGNPLLPASEIQPHIEHARSKMLAVNGHGQAFSLADNVASWLGFLCTATVTLILGYFGRRAPADGAGADLSGLPLRMARVMGVLAALAAVLTAAGALAKNQARDDYQKADSARNYINAAVSDLSAAKSEREARDALDQLDLQIGRL